MQPWRTVSARSFHLSDTQRAASVEEGAGVVGELVVLVEQRDTVVKALLGKIAADRGSTGSLASWHLLKAALDADH